MKRTQSSVNFQTDAVIHDMLRETAEAEARSVSSLVRKIIADWYAERTPPRQHRKRPEASTAA
jgi:hypothetical protein